MTFASAKEAINHIKRAMEVSDAYLHKGTPSPRGLPAELFSLKGLSSPACRIFFNEICNKAEARYLEVGTYTGSSIISACWKNPLRRAVGIVDWSMDKSAKPKLESNIQFFKDDLMFGRYAPEFIEAEAFSMDKTKLGQFDIYFYDGHHSADSQEKGLTCFWDNLAPVSIVIVDDYSVMRVQQGTIRAIDKLGCRQHLRYAWTLSGGESFEHLYWGGLAVMVFEK